jgi:hypothetical protein
MVKMCGLKSMWIAVRPADRHSDGTFYVDQNPFIVVSNRFTAGIFQL